MNHLGMLTKRRVNYWERTAMSFKKQVKAINEFLSVMYDQEMRLSKILKKSGLDDRQIKVLRTHHLEQTVGTFLETLKQILVTGSGNDRLYVIINFRFGLEGQTEETLHTIGKRLGVTRERIRQLERKALRKCRHRVNKSRIETKVYRVAAEILGIQVDEPELAKSLIETQPKRKEQKEAGQQELSGSVTTIKGTGEWNKKTYSVEEKRKEYQKAYAKWTKGEDERLKELYIQGKTINELSSVFERSEGAINTRLVKLGLISESQA